MNSVNKSNRDSANNKSKRSEKRLLNSFEMNLVLEEMVALMRDRLIAREVLSKEMNSLNLVHEFWSKCRHLK